MIGGIGNDIIEVSRVARVISKYGCRFLDKIFTPQEQLYCNGYNDSERRYAGRFAAKEAIAKALGTGFQQGVSWLDIEILPSSDGKPEVKVQGLIKTRFNDPQILLTISHCREYATAMALWVREEK